MPGEKRPTYPRRTYELVYWSVGVGVLASIALVCCVKPWRSAAGHALAAKRSDNPPSERDGSEVSDGDGGRAEVAEPVPASAAGAEAVRESTALCVRAVV